MEIGMIICKMDMESKRINLISVTRVFGSTGNGMEKDSK